MLRAPTFILPAALPSHTQKPCATCVPPKMSSPKGFSSKPERRAKTESQQRRERAAKRYDEMASAGMPEYTVWMRLKSGGVQLTEEPSEEKMPWLPVGCISVPRSDTVSNVLFEAEEDLMQGAERLYPKLKDEPRDNIEFGYQLREFDDEEIRVAERPSDGVVGVLRAFFGRLQNPMNAK